MPSRKAARNGRRQPPAPFVPCTDKKLPESLAVEAAKTAVAINRRNEVRPQVAAAMAAQGIPVTPLRLALDTAKFWGSKGVDLGVTFMDSPSRALKDKILSHMNAWNKTANVRFRESAAGEVRLHRGYEGYWSYLGTDILHIPQGQPTMNLQGFTEATPEAEYRRVVRHETGHTLGFPHEHLRRELVDRLDPQKTYDFFLRTQGWDRQQTAYQVLNPISEATIRGTLHADQTSVMCYQLPGSITRDGQPIVGGVDIDDLDYEFVAQQYPKGADPVTPPVNPPAPTGPAGKPLVSFGTAANVPAGGAILVRNLPHGLAAGHYGVWPTELVADALSAREAAEAAAPYAADADR